MVLTHAPVYEAILFRNTVLMALLEIDSFLLDSGNFINCFLVLPKFIVHHDVWIQVLLQLLDDSVVLVPWHLLSALLNYFISSYDLLLTF